MGTKRDQAAFLAETVRANFPKAIVVDAFAGTCSVATALCRTHVVWANDVHRFAATVAHAALVETNPKPSLDTAITALRTPFQQNLQSLSALFADALLAEHVALNAVIDKRNWKGLLHLHDHPHRPRQLNVVDYRNNPGRQPYALFTLLYQHTYFGLRQSIELDSLRYAIEKADPGHRPYYMWALFRAVSHCAAAPGHFAQYFVPRDETNSALITKYRRRSIWSRFLEEYNALAIPDCYARHKNAAFNEAAIPFLSRLPRLAAGASCVIYADPPYSRAQYSRYYHVLETLALYDYPHISHKGRYRDGRFNTDFSRAGKVAEAIEEFVARAAAASLPLFLSYPNNGLFIKRGGNLAEVMRRHYARVVCMDRHSREHSTLGGAPGSASITVSETLYFGDTK